MRCARELCLRLSIRRTANDRQHAQNVEDLEKCLDSQSQVFAIYTLLAVSCFLPLLESHLLNFQKKIFIA